MRRFQKSFFFVFYLFSIMVIGCSNEWENTRVEVVAIELHIQKDIDSIPKFVLHLKSSSNLDSLFEESNGANMYFQCELKETLMSEPLEDSGHPAIRSFDFMYVPDGDATAPGHLYYIPLTFEAPGSFRPLKIPEIISVLRQEEKIACNIVIANKDYRGNYNSPILYLDAMTFLEKLSVLDSELD